MVALQLQKFWNETDYLDAFQLGLKSECGMETVWVILFCDLWQERDGDSESILVLLHISAAFIKHSILL